MKKNLTVAVGIFVITVLLGQSAQAVQRVWGNTGTDYNTGTSWTGGIAPGVGDVGAFTTAETTQPNLSSSLSNAGLFFNAVSGYDLTSSGGAVLTLTGTATTAGGTETSNSSAAAIGSTNTTGNNTVDASLILAPASGTVSTFTQSSGGTLIVNGVVSSAAGINLSLKGGGTIQLNALNSFASASIDSASEVVVLGNNGALGSGTFTINNTSTLQAGGGARTLANNVVLGGNTTLSGSNAFTFNGTATSSGSNSRTLTVSNTGGATFGGSVFLQEAAATGRTFTINGTSAVAINGVVQDGGTGLATLKYTGSNTLTLNNTNTYSGGTQLTIAGSTLVANKDGALGSGNVSLTTGGVTLTLQNGVLNNYIADSANLSLVSTAGGSTVNLNFTGTADTINMLLLDGVAQAPGLYGSATSGAPNVLSEFIGTGELLVTTAIPEPATTMLIGIGLLLGVQRLRRKSR